MGMGMSYNEFADLIHTTNHRWWHDENGDRLDRNIGEMLMLVITEISECCEGERKALMDDHLPHRRMAEVELADALIRIFDIAGAWEIDLRPARVMVLQLTDNKGESLLRMCGMVWHTYIEWCQIPSGFYYSLNCYRKADAHGKEMGAYLRALIDGILEYGRRHDYSIWDAVADKLEYNSTRPDHQYEARAQAHGKKW